MMYDKTTAARTSNDARITIRENKKMSFSGNSKNRYGVCPDCGCGLEPVWFIEEETIVRDGIEYHTGRQRKAVDVLRCPCCLRDVTVDDSFDGPWVIA